MAVQLETQTIDEAKMQDLLHRFVQDLGASLSVTLGYLGQKLGLYQALRDGGPSTVEELARRTGTAERYVREWLINQAASGYVTYEPDRERYSLSSEQATAFADESSPFYVAGGFYVAKALNNARSRIENLFRSGAGMPWRDHDPDLFIGTERFFRPGYAAHLVTEWIPALSGTEKRLKSGGRVADVGCGHGASTVIMAQAFPKSKFFGFDSHAQSIARARAAAKDSGVDRRTSFEVCDATDFPGEGYDLVAFFDCLHDMADPLGAIQRAKETLGKGGSAMIVEPMAGERVEDNFNPVGRTFSAASTLCCTANSLAGGGPALGALATDKTLRDLFRKAGFRSFERVAETPFNRVFEARP